LPEDHVKHQAFRHNVDDHLIETQCQWDPLALKLVWVVVHVLHVLQVFTDHWIDPQVECSRCGDLGHNWGVEWYNIDMVVRFMLVDESNGLADDHTVLNHRDHERLNNIR